MFLDGFLAAAFSCSMKAFSRAHSAAMAGHHERSVPHRAQHRFVSAGHFLPWWQTRIYLCIAMLSLLQPISAGCAHLLMSTLPNQAPSPSCSERCPGSQRGVPPRHRSASHRRLRWRALRPRAERNSGGGPDESGNSSWERADHEREAERLFRSAQLQEQQRPGAEYGEVSTASSLPRDLTLDIAADAFVGPRHESRVQLWWLLCFRPSHLAWLQQFVLAVVRRAKPLHGARK